MKFLEKLYKGLVRLQKNPEMPEVYDLELNHIDELKSNRFTSLECHVVFYPYSRKINSDSFEFTPFEEYINDIAAYQKSAYVKIQNRFCNIFGLFLGLMIAGLFLILKPGDLFTIESIVSIIGAYFVGKELWTDIEELMINISKNWRIRYLERYYFYRLEKHTTLSLYSHLAKKRRYGKAAMLPEKMDFIQKRNSETLRMIFNMKDLKTLKEKSAHILSLRLDPALLQELENEGFMLGIKLSFNKRFLGLTRCREFFQSTDKDLIGCLSEKGIWNNNALFYRNTFRLGRIKFFMNKGLLQDKHILDIKLNPKLT